MRNLDTRMLSQAACDKFTTHQSMQQEGMRILNEITDLTETLKTMDDLTQIHIGSFENSTWRVPLTVERIKLLVRTELDGRRQELREKFNRMFTPAKSK